MVDFDEARRRARELYGTKAEEPKSSTAPDFAAARQRAQELYGTRQPESRMISIDAVSAAAPVSPTARLERRHEAAAREIETLEERRARLDGFMGALSDGTWTPDEKTLQYVTGGKPLEEARAELEEQIGGARETLGALANRHSYAMDSEMLGRLMGDGALYGEYRRALEAREDMEKLQAVQSAATLQSGEPVALEERDSLREKYGLEAETPVRRGGMRANTGEMDALMQRLLDEEAAAEDALKAAGYDFGRLSRFEGSMADAQRYEQTQAETERFAEEHPYLASAASILAAPAQGLDYLRMAYEGIGRRDPGDLASYEAPNIYSMDVTNYVSAVRGTVSQKIEENTNWELFGQNVASFLYQTGMSVGDSALQVAVLGPAATLFMGASAASGQARDVIARGGTAEQAFWGGLAAGAAETFFEKFSVDQLLKAKTVNSVKSLLGETVKQMGVEASEETFTEIANILSDAAIMGENSDYANAVRAYRDQGMTEDAAEKQAFFDCVAQVAWAGVGGALSGGVMGGAVNSANYLGGKANDAGVNRGIDRAYQAMEEYGMFSPEAETASARANERLGFQPETAGAIRYEENPGQQKTASTGEAEAWLVPLSEQAERNLSTGKNNVVAKTVGDIISFVKQSLAKKGVAERLYMGTIPDSTAAMVETSTGINVKGYNAILPGDSVQHTFNHHGDPQVESARGQRAVTAEDMAAIPQVLAAPDSVSLSGKTDNLGRHVLLFEKQIGDTFITAQAVTDGRHALTTNSLWVQKKKGPLDTTHNTGENAGPVLHVQDAPPSGPSLDTTIPQAGRGVKGKDALEGAEYAPRTQAGRDLDLSRAARLASTLGENGSKAFTTAYDGNMDLETAFEGFARVYNAAMEGRTPPEVSLPETLRMAARAAGENDAPALARKGPGLVTDSYTATLDNDLVREIDQVSKLLGVKTRFADEVAGGEANAQIENGVITIERGNKHPVRLLLGHEITHRIQELSPKSYRAFQRAALAELGDVEGEVLAQQAIRRKHNLDTSREAVLDELTADFAGKLIDDRDLLIRFVERNRADRSLLQRLRDAFHALAEKLTGKRKKQAQDAEMLLLQALDDAVRSARKMEKKNAAREGGGAKYSLNADFGRQFDQWMEERTQGERENSHFRFAIGTTSDALKSIGVSDYKIYWGASKIAKIMEKHPGMTADVIKSVPEVLEHPILVMQSQTVANRITLFGEAVDADGAPVLAAVELSPQKRTGEIRDFGVIASAYGKKNAQGIIDTSDILYIEPDKSRTDQWLLVLGLQLPSSITTYGSIHSVTQVKRDVNGNISFGETGGKTAVQLAMEKAQAEKAARGKGFTEHDGDEHTAVRYSLKETDGRRMPVVANTTYGALTQKQGNLKLLEQAKAGDAEAARRLLVRVLKTDFFAQTARFFKGAELVPVRYREGGNALPLTLAEMTAERSRNKVFKDIYQTEHSGMKDHGDSWGRLMEPVKFAFDGKTPNLTGRRFVLVDDVVSSGSTLMALTHALEAAGGQVDGYLALARGRYVADDMAMTPGIRQAVEARLGRENVERVLSRRLGYEVKLENLTDKQGRAILAHQGELKALLAGMGRDTMKATDMKEAEQYGRGEEADTGHRRIPGADVRGEDFRLDAGGTGAYSEAAGRVPEAVRGAKSIPGWAQGHVVENTRNSAAARGAMLAGAYIPDTIVVEDSAIKQRNSDALALTSGGTICLSDALEEKMVDIVSHHEVVHAVKQRGSAEYDALLGDMGGKLDFLNPSMERVMGAVLKSRYKGKSIFDLTLNEMETAFDELNALVWGYHKADPEHAKKEFGGLFTDYDAYIAELDGIMEGAKGTADLARMVKGAETAGAEAGQEGEARRLWEELGTQSPYFKRFYDGNAPQLYEADGTPKVVYHGTAQPIHIFDKAKRGSFTRVKDATMGFFFTSSEKVAKGYAENTFPTEILKLRDEFDRAEALLGEVPEADALFKKVREKYEQAVRNYRSSGVSGALMQVYLSMKNPAVEDFKGAAYQGNSGRYTRLIQEALEAGKDGVVFQNVYDTFGSEKFREVSDVFVVFEPEQIKSATDNIGTFDSADPDVRHSLKGSLEMSEAVKELMERAKREGMGRDEINREIEAAAKRIYQTYVDRYGAIPPGEKPAREVQAPRKTGGNAKVSQTVRTVLEAEATPEAAVPTIQKLVAEGTFSYEAYSDKQAIREAGETVRDKGYTTALMDWSKAVRDGNVSKANTAMGWALYDAAANAGDMKTAMTVLTDIVAHQRSAAQAVQATRILKQMSPEAQLYGVRRSVGNLQEELKARYGDRAPTLHLDEGLAEKLLGARTEQGRTEAMKELYRDIGRQMPSRFIDKWNAWRYLAMLANPRTHVRNVVGNAGFAPVVLAKNMLATGIEAAVDKATGGKLARTKGAVGPGKADRALLGAAWGDYAGIQEQALGGGKYSDMQNANKYIEEGRTVFRLKPVEAARKANSAALDMEDVWFSRPHYAFALAQYCKANGITAEQLQAGESAVLDRARAYAIQEAQKATYRDANALSDAVSRMGRYRGGNPVAKGLSVLTEGILPFRKTPANILARGLEYSPAGLLKGLTYDLAQVKGGAMTAAEAIDNISAGLAGTGLLALGFFLAAQGLVRGAGAGDDEEKDFDKLQGHQTYALELPDGTSVTLDWLAPEALPFFVGVNLCEQTAREGEEMNMSDMLQAMGSVTEPLLEMSCLQSLNDIFDAVGYAGANQDVSPVMGALASAATSYLTQAVPTLLGQFERTAQDQRMTTYTTKDAFLTPNMQYTLGRTSARIPGWDFGQIPYIDAWGRTENAGGLAERAAGNFLNPAYTSGIETSAMEEELERLYRQTGKSGVLPGRAEKSFQVNGETKYLTAEEYVAYATQRGQTAYRVLTELTASDAYQAMDDAARAEAAGLVYQYANATAKTAVSDYEPESWVKKATAAVAKYHIPETTYLCAYLEQKGIESIPDKNGDTIDNSWGLLVMQMVNRIPGLTEMQRQALYADFGVGQSILHYNRALVNEKLNEMRRK